MAPPSSEALELSAEDIRRCARMLEALVGDRTQLFCLSDEERVALITAAGRLSRPTKYEQIRAARVMRRKERGRRKALDRESRASTGIRAARRGEVFVAPSQAGPAPGPERELEHPRDCYVCKAEFRRQHFFYDSMCPECAAFNYAKRFQTARLDGRVAVITGARVKIGYQAALMMLRAGARVVVTTRFPHDAAGRYRREADFAQWNERLQVHGLDLRHSPSVEIFAAYLDRTLGRLDFLINNAAQTVRRPPGFYAHLLDGESRSAMELSEASRGLLGSHEACKAALAGSLGSAPSGDWRDQTGLAVWHGGGRGIGLRASARLSQVPYGYEDASLGLEAFPKGKRDADLQQVDLRRVNSWRLALADVPTPEMLELQLINSVAPFILCAKLKGLMLRERTGDKHIVNVSAMEGSFSRRTKTDKHPHTNMAKAALNMMTLTSAPDYANDGIFMNAVDTGWVTDEDPIDHSTRKQAVHDFQPPLDIIDGAARICDPFFSGLLTGRHVWGKFLKDYKPTPW